ncbi:hypothetical protein J2Z20_003411 [Paenibacillus sediminis]|uniref:Uncharacterized protein n=1 Tax=Paenibacillus sediminis TaxID=664909 RepID=A0ABS4H7I7_9BACL|nr:hypothetical protein [Paenibacillus sediminis]
MIGGNIEKNMLDMIDLERDQKRLECLGVSNQVNV